MKASLCLITVFALLSVLTGCEALLRSNPPAVSSRAVTEITVTFNNGPLHLQRQYETPEKMQKILNYLRQIDPYGCPQENPADMPGGHFRIVLTYSDGQEKVYQQKADQYLRVEGGQWELIQPKKAQMLSHILGQLESDR